MKDFLCEGVGCMTKSLIPRCEPDTHVVYLAIVNEVMMTEILCKY